MGVFFLFLFSFLLGFCFPVLVISNEYLPVVKVITWWVVERRGMGSKKWDGDILGEDLLQNGVGCFGFFFFGGGGSLLHYIKHILVNESIVSQAKVGFLKSLH